MWGKQGDLPLPTSCVTGTLNGSLSLFPACIWYSKIKFLKRKKKRECHHQSHSKPVLQVLFFFIGSQTSFMTESDAPFGTGPGMSASCLGQLLNDRPV